VRVSLAPQSRKGSVVCFGLPSAFFHALGALFRPVASVAVTASAPAIKKSPDKPDTDGGWKREHFD